MRSKTFWLHMNTEWERNEILEEIDEFIRKLGHDYLIIRVEAEKDYGLGKEYNDEEI